MTLRSEVIARLDTVTALANRNYADEAPEHTPFPYTTFLTDISRTPMLKGDAKTIYWHWLGQVDLWQSRASEDSAILQSVLNALDGFKLTAGLRLRVLAAPRLQDPNYEVSHYAITVASPVAR